jgi:hypothetical protein
MKTIQRLHLPTDTTAFFLAGDGLELTGLFAGSTNCLPSIRGRSTPMEIGEGFVDTALTTLLCYSVHGSGLI